MENNTILIVDDICDSGCTLDVFKRLGCDTAAIIYRNVSKHKPNYIGQFIVHDKWLVLPYEREHDTVSTINENNIKDRRTQ